MSFGYYTYWSGVQLAGAEIHFIEDGGLLVFPTNDSLTCVAIGGPTDLFTEFRKDIEHNYSAVIERIPSLAEKMRGAKREARFVGTNDQPNFFRRPYGPGWALVGDAGYHRDFITGLGITDAFRDAELLTEAIDDGFSGRRPLDEAMADYERQRNQIAEPLYELTTQLISGDPPTIEQFLAFGAAMQAMMPEEIDAHP
jgi:flavin-dependent dehydrogenase